MFYPDENEYIKLAEKYNSIPVSIEWPCDTETPITVYTKVAGKKRSFLLESVEGGERLGRYSFIGIEPQVMISCHRGATTVIRNGKEEHLNGDPFLIINDILKDFQSPAIKGLPRFYGGAVGYLGYDMVRHLEVLPDLNREETGIQDCMLMVPAVNIIIDHIKHTIRVVANTQAGDDAKDEYKKAVSTIKNVLASITGGDSPPGLNPVGNYIPKMVTTNLSRTEFIEIVEKAKEYIRSGEILQVVLSRRIDQDFKGDPFNVYRRLRRNNPSPYLYFLNMGSVVMAGSSPEMLVRVEESDIETRPIAGTRPRGSNHQEDMILSSDLLSDIKERAEHLMLVDLGRNDVGKVSKSGTVKVPQFMDVEMYSHVMHLVSSVRGILKQDLSGIDALKACFPAGTVSGAPKIRAMEIIEELEPSRRGPYAGAVGYIGFNGNVDTAIAIRTIVFHDGKASVQAGAGIVADSDPAMEFTETENKAGALLNALAEEDNKNAVNY